MPSRRTASPAAGRVALVAVAVAALAACTPSKIDAAADVAVRGRLLHQAGSRPASGRTVYLTRDLGPSDLLPGVLTAGLACLSDDKPEVCRSGVRHDLTESDGRFAFDLKGRDTQTVFGNTRHFNLAAEVSPPPGHVDGA
ncbi:MAG: hypothetical protein QOG03_176, partial [Actinomycetota bacterium]|nr:hypothetical protein [Actinomycetota bacterium]